MMLPIKTLFPFFILPLSTLAQTILNPVACTLICIQKSLSVTSCEQAQNGVSNQSELPCLCGDNVFLRETINCIINLGECPSVKDEQDSFSYAVGICKSNGVNLPGDTPADLPAALGVSLTRPNNTPSSKLSETSSTPEVSIISKTITTMIGVTTSIACEPSHVGNATYTVVVSNNSTHTQYPKSTGGTCGNFTTTIPFTTTIKSTKTATPRTSTGSSSTGTASVSTSTSASGAQGTTVQSGFILALLSLLMWFV